MTDASNGTGLPQVSREEMLAFLGYDPEEVSTLSDEELREHFERAVIVRGQQLQAQLGQAVHATHPSKLMGYDEQKLMELIASIVTQVEETLPQMMRDLKERAPNPYWGFVATDVASGEKITAAVPKDSARLATLQEKLIFANVLALAHEPAVLAWLALHGVQLQFVQSADRPGQKKLIVPS